MTVRQRGASSRKRGGLTLSIRSHVRHGGILHHSCRAGRSHHGGIRARWKVARLTAHGELLRVIHHLLRLSWGWAGLHVRILLLWGAVEGLAASRVGVTIRSRVHG